MGDWRDGAECLGDPEREDRYASERTEPEKVERAVAVCETCPVAMARLDFALAVDEGWGNWGGFTAPIVDAQAMACRGGRPRERFTPGAEQVVTKVRGITWAFCSML